MLATLHSERFQDQTPRQVYAELLDEGTYLASPSTMYRILAAHRESEERRAQREARSHAVPRLEASAPNQVWTWDISKLATCTTGVFLNLYLVLDLSRAASEGAAAAEAPAKQDSKGAQADWARTTTKARRLAAREAQVAAVAPAASEEVARVGSQPPSRGRARRLSSMATPGCSSALGELVARTEPRTRLSLRVSMVWPRRWSRSSDAPREFACPNADRGCHKHDTAAQALRRL